GSAWFVQADWPGLISGWTGLRFSVGYGFGSVGSRCGFSHRATSGKGMGVGHVFLGLDAVGLLFAGGYIFGRQVGAHLRSVGSVHGIALGALSCVLSSAVWHTVVLVLCVAALAAECGCCGAGVTGLCGCIGLFSLVLGWGLLVC
ncbi:hypothetical protein ATANTOWER_001734, partial [Ataeniobius toweri]|nr:hypothetical protein [Ataeniobius toweri]